MQNQGCRQNSTATCHSFSSTSSQEVALAWPAARVHCVSAVMHARLVSCSAIGGAQQSWHTGLQAGAGAVARDNI
jgi:hypothetical protein